MDDEHMDRDAAPPAGQTQFVVMFRSEEGERYARIVIEGLRAFGGRLRDSPVRAFVLDPGRLARALPGLEGVHPVPLAVQEALEGYPFAEKVSACARAEEMAGPDVRSLVWLNLDCLIVNPPLLFDLPPPFAAAFRPVHHRNVGSPAGEPLDAYWAGIYRQVGLDESSFTVESFVDGLRLRPYLNTHCFAVDPSRGLLRDWLACFQAMVADRAYQAGACGDELHRIFLHQAVLSALASKSLAREEIRWLPAEYSYPLHMQQQVPGPRRAATLNSLVCAVYEEAVHVRSIPAREPLRSWLRERGLG
jgi:hypothetical protein